MERGLARMNAEWNAGRVGHGLTGMHAGQ